MNRNAISKELFHAAHFSEHFADSGCTRFPHIEKYLNSTLKHYSYCCLWQEATNPQATDSKSGLNFTLLIANKCHFILEIYPPIYLKIHKQTLNTKPKLRSKI